MFFFQRSSHQIVFELFLFPGKLSNRSHVFSNTHHRNGSSPCVTFPDVLLHLWPFDVCSSTLLVYDFDWYLRRLTFARLFFRCVIVLGHSLVHDLVIKNVHDFCKRFTGNFNIVDGFYNPSTLDTSSESLPLRIPGIPGLGNDFHHHRIFSVSTRRIPQDTEWPFLEGDLCCRTSCISGREIFCTLRVFLFISWVMSTCRHALLVTMAQVHFC